MILLPKSYSDLLHDSSLFLCQQLMVQFISYYYFWRTEWCAELQNSVSHRLQWQTGECWMLF